MVHVLSCYVGFFNSDFLVVSLVSVVSVFLGGAFFHFGWFYFLPMFFCIVNFFLPYFWFSKVFLMYGLGIFIFKNVSFFLLQVVVFIKSKLSQWFWMFLFLVWFLLLRFFWYELFRLRLSVIISEIPKCRLCPFMFWHGLVSFLFSWCYYTQLLIRG